MPTITVAEFRAVFARHNDLITSPDAEIESLILVATEVVDDLRPALDATREIRPSAVAHLVAHFLDRQSISDPAVGGNSIRVVDGRVTARDPLQATRWGRTLSRDDRGPRQHGRNRRVREPVSLAQLFRERPPQRPLRGSPQPVVRALRVGLELVAGSAERLVDSPRPTMRPLGGPVGGDRTRAAHPEAPSRTPGTRCRRARRPSAAGPPTACGRRAAGAHAAWTA